MIEGHPLLTALWTLGKAVVPFLLFVCLLRLVRHIVEKYRKLR